MKCAQHSSIFAAEDEVGYFSLVQRLRVSSLAPFEGRDVMKGKTVCGSSNASAVGTWEMLAVAALVPAARRIRTHGTRKRQLLEQSICASGMLDPITINSANVVVDGHLRLQIATKRGFREVPVIRISHLSDAELRAHAIAANKLPAVATYDLDLLRLEFEEIRAETPKIDFTLIGFTISEMDRLDGRYLAGIYDDLDEDPPADPADAVAKFGDLYALGEHRLCQTKCTDR